MASCRVCDLRTLVVIMVGLLTTIVLGLSIWRAVVRIQRGNVVLLCLTSSERRRGASVPAPATVLKSAVSGLRLPPQLALVFYEI